ncbi:MAG: ABC transporter permease subunit [Acidihalobacter sp.]|uniref:ABC transporter permease subunit n=1 Tax=Acidihalobacter sp. TaxID=1872108 RepID=UPI00307DB247
MKAAPTATLTSFPNRWLPYLLLAPQLAITCVFFVWPAFKALSGAFYQSNPFGLGSYFVGLGNFTALFADPAYLHAIGITLVYSLSTTVLSMGMGLFLAVLTEDLVAGHTFFRTLFIWPYAVAPAIAGALWLFAFAPQIGPATDLLAALGIQWNYALNGTQALLLIISLTAWQQIAYNFLFFTAGLQGIPDALLEAASLDGASYMRRFFGIVFPLLAPTTFFLLIMNITYVFFDTFGVISIVTQGGPSNATQTLVYKVYQDGFQNLNLGSAAAQSIILMLLVGLLTLFQFRYLDRQIHYQ